MILVLPFNDVSSDVSYILEPEVSANGYTLSQELNLIGETYTLHLKERHHKRLDLEYEPFGHRLHHRFNPRKVNRKGR